MERDHNFENKIDDLLSGRLSTEDESSVLEQIQQDPSLASEYNFQKDLIEGIKLARKSELKARLSAIPIEPTLIGGLFTSAALKYAASVLLITSVGLGLYFYSPTKTTPARESIPFAPAKTLPIDLSTVAKAEMPEKIANFDLKSIHNSKELTASANTTVIFSEQVAAEEPISVPTINQPVIADNFNDELPESPSIDRFTEIGNKKDANIPNTTIENISDSKYSFHYRYFESKLFLYGDFKGIPYEIIEIHAKDGRTTYLKYEDAYYQLQSSTKNIKPLEMIEDKELIREIQLLNNQKSQ